MAKLEEKGAHVTYSGGRVIGVKFWDGNKRRGIPETLNSPTTYTVDLIGIDAPEAEQEWGDQARQSLSELVLGKTVFVAVPDEVPKERTAGWVEVVQSVTTDGISTEFKGENVNFALVREGHAWHDVASTPDNTALGDTQSRAKEAGRGLWSKEKPTPPWEWRQKQKVNSAGQ